MSEAPDYPLGEYPDVRTTLGLCQAIDQIRDTALAGYAELMAERDEALAERDKARAERDDLRAKAAWNSGRQL